MYNFAMWLNNNPSVPINLLAVLICMEESIESEANEENT